jgi:hypothetical protein
MDCEKRTHELDILKAVRPVDTFVDLPAFNIFRLHGSAGIL